MISLSNGFGQGSPFTGYNSTELKSLQNYAEQRATQTNIKGETEQQLAQAVSPIVEINLIKNQKNKSTNLSQPEDLTERVLNEDSIPPQKTSIEETKESSKNSKELTEEEEKQVQELKKRDAEVKAHEQAHAAVGGSYASAPSYEYTTGPDNKQYAIAGEVQIDASPIPNNPSATIRKMDIVIRAALAPAEPSSQDKQVAAQAQKHRLEAQAELTKQQSSKEEGQTAALDTNSLTANLKSQKQTKTSDRLEAILAYKSASNYS